MHSGKISRPDDITSTVQVHESGAFGDAGLRRQGADYSQPYITPLNAPSLDVGDRAPSRRSAESALRSPRLSESGLRNRRKQACAEIRENGKSKSYPTQIW
jgi:hypothetical protein